MIYAYSQQSHDHELQKRKKTIFFFIKQKKKKSYKWTNQQTNTKTERQINNYTHIRKQKKTFEIPLQQQQKSRILKIFREKVMRFLNFVSSNNSNN